MSFTSELLRLLNWNTPPEVQQLAPEVHGAWKTIAFPIFSGEISLLNFRRVGILRSKISTPNLGEFSSATGWSQKKFSAWNCLRAKNRGRTIFVVYPALSKVGEKKRSKIWFCEKNRVWGKQKKPPSLVPKMGKNAEKKVRCESKAESIERLSEAVICRGISCLYENVAALKMVGPPLFFNGCFPALKSMKTF